MLQCCHRSTGNTLWFFGGVFFSPSLSVYWVQLKINSLSPLCFSSNTQFTSCCQLPAGLATSFNMKHFALIHQWTMMPGGLCLIGFMCRYRLVLQAGQQRTVMTAVHLTNSSTGLPSSCAQYCNHRWLSSYVKTKRQTVLFLQVVDGWRSLN